MNTRVPKIMPRHITEGFSDRLIVARADVGLTQEELSAATRPEGGAEDSPGLISVRTISDWENDASYPSLGPGIRAIAKALGVTLAWLLRGDTSGAGAGHRSDDPRSPA